MKRGSVSSSMNRLLRDHVATVIPWAHWAGMITQSVSAPFSSLIVPALPREMVLLNASYWPGKKKNKNVHIRQTNCCHDYYIWCQQLTWWPERPLCVQCIHQQTNFARDKGIFVPVVVCFLIVLAVWKQQRWLLISSSDKFLLVDLLNAMTHQPSQTSLSFDMQRWNFHTPPLLGMRRRGNCQTCCWRCFVREWFCYSGCGLEGSRCRRDWWNLLHHLRTPTGPHLSPRWTPGASTHLIEKEDNSQIGWRQS